MAEIFISYASENRQRAQVLAEAVGARGWSVWWDRDIPIGQSFDELIERALAESKCVIVLWSAASVASEWVRNEASEARRRGILVPVFIESVAAPLAFRLLNGADLRDWRGDPGDAEFARLVERVAQLLAQRGDDSAGDVLPKARLREPPLYNGTRTKRRLVGSIVLASAIAVAGAGAAAYVLRNRQHQPPPSVPTVTPEKIDQGIGTTNREKQIRGLVGPPGSAIPAASLARAFYIPELGMQIAFFTPEQSASMLGMMPAGAVVMAVESGPIAGAGIHAGDVVLSIGGRQIVSENDLRQAIHKTGPGKTQFSYRRGSDTRTVAVDCPTCKAD